MQNFLPTLPRGTFPIWVEKMGISNHLLIDPISANPLLSVELAASGYRILSARSNPIIWLMTEVIAAAPTEGYFATVLNKLLNTRHGDITLSDHLQSLYETSCLNCGKMIQPDGFVWDKDKNWPIFKVYQCKHCGDGGEKGISDFDRENLIRLGNLGIHRSRAFQRVVFGGAYEQTSLNEALDCYLPRALYVCMLLVNVLDRLSLEKDQSKNIRAVLLSVFNDAHSLKHWPPRDYRFLQLSVPPRYFENNLYLSLQKVTQQWRHIENPVEISYWPNLPKERGGICFFQRELADKNQLVPENIETSITTIFPRPGQAFWTLSAIWAGWLWGKKAVSPMRSALSRRRYDWLWFTKAVHIALNRISTSLHTDTICLGLFPEYTPNLAFGLFTGMQTAGYQLEGSAYRNSDAILQCQWVRNPNIPSINRSEIDLREIVRHYLALRGEPAEYHHIIMHVIIDYARKNGISGKLSEITETDFTQLQNLIKQLLSDIYFLNPHQSELPGGSRWWLINEKNIECPISERVEIEIRNFLMQRNETQIFELDLEICSKFNGSQTPERDLINATLQAYADPKPENPNIFRLRLNETSTLREKDLIEIKELIKKNGNSFHLQVSGEETISWIDPITKEILYIFYPTITAEISRFVFRQKAEERIHQVIVFPGSRSSLLYYRLSHDPRLSSATKERWHFLKFRSVRSLGERENLNLESWEELLDSDPPLLNSPNQLPII
ncbi:MAG: hypothetical protein Q7J07_11250 [Pelolinea sp.]|nr:hypothetical protein [Pelolinea sp.]